MKLLICLFLMFVGQIGYSADDKCDKDLDPRGKIIGYESPDGDPIYENLGPQTGNTYDGTPIYQKTGPTYGHHRKLGNVTGYTPDGDALYDGESSPKYSYDGDRETKTSTKKDYGYDP
jgi:hypothetical protein